MRKKMKVNTPNTPPNELPLFPWPSEFEDDYYEDIDNNLLDKEFDIDEETFEYEPDIDDDQI